MVYIPYIYHTYQPNVGKYTMHGSYIGQKKKGVVLMLYSLSGVYNPFGIPPTLRKIGERQPEQILNVCPNAVGS